MAGQHNESWIAVAVNWLLVALLSGISLAAWGVAARLFIGVVGWAKPALILRDPIAAWMLFTVASVIAVLLATRERPKK